MVILTRIYERRRLAECLWEGMIGLFVLDDLQLVHNSKAAKDVDTNGLIHTPSRNLSIGEENTPRMSRKSEPKNSQRSRPGMRVLQPSDMNRITEEEFKEGEQVNNFYDFESNPSDYDSNEFYRRDGSMKADSYPQNSTNTMKYELRNTPRNPYSLKLSCKT